MAYWQEYGAPSGWEENWPLVLWTYTGSRTSTSTLEITWDTYTLPANTLGSNDALEIHMSCNFSQQSSANSLDIVLDDGSTTSDLVNVSASTPGSSWNTIWFLIAQNSQTSQVSGFSPTVLPCFSSSATAVTTYTYNLGTTDLDIIFKTTIGAAGTTKFNAKILQLRKPV